MCRRPILVMIILLFGGSASAAEPACDILMIAVDDLNDWVGCLQGHPQVQTPHIDALARRGTLFANAHCQAPLCNPSRTSLLTGLRPSATGIYTLQPGFRDVEQTRTVETIFQYFARLGYHTSVYGKVFHDGAIAPSARQKEVDEWGIAPGMPRPPQRLSKGAWTHPAMDWGIFPIHDHEQADWKIADAAIAAMQHLPTEKPSLMSVGFRLPHVPCFASRPWFDLYPLDKLQLPAIRDDDRADIPEFAWAMHWKLPEPRLSELKQANEWKGLVRAYLASISFMDSQVGRVLQAFDQQSRGRPAMVVLWSDHGWHLGEKGITGKNSLWERSTRVPLIFAGSQMTAGAVCHQPAELLDLYPTLVELAGQTVPPALEGHSLVPQLRDANARREWPAITTHNQGNHAIRSERWRFIRYADGSEELYDLQSDPHEWTNLAQDSKFVDERETLRRWLPKVDSFPAAGSAHRLLVRQGDEWLWEGQPLRWDELIR